MDFFIAALCFLIAHFVQIESYPGSIDFKNSKCTRLEDCSHVNNLLKTKQFSYGTTTLLNLLHCDDSTGTIYVRCIEADKVEDFINRADLIPNYNKCGLIIPTNKIHGGQKTNIDDFPWIALLRYRNSEDKLIYGCHGNLITNRYLLTAAHCVHPNETYKRIKAYLFSVVLGEYDIKNQTDCVGLDCADPVKEVPVESYNIHPDFNFETFVNDIALIRLKLNVEYTDFIKPICLPPKNLITPRSDETLFIAGWGNTENNEMNEVKMSANFQLRPQNTCKVNINLTAKQFCATSVEEAKTCPGDSGGPLMMKRKLDADRLFLIGVNSLGVGCSVNVSISIYTQIPPYIEWIVTTIHK